MSEAGEKRQVAGYREFLLLVLASFIVLAWSCGSTDSREGWQPPPESPWRFGALLNGESIDVEADTAWNHPSPGIRFAVFLSTYEDWPYRSKFTIKPGIRSVPLDTMLILNDKDRLNQFQQTSFHTRIWESDDDVTVATYNLSANSTNYIRFTRLEEEGVDGRYRAVIKGEYEATYLHDATRDSQIPGLSDHYRQLPDTVRITQGRFETVLLEWEDRDYWKKQNK